MLSYDGQLMRVLGKIGNYCMLNFLWIICSLPIITVFPATVALLGVVKGWADGNEPPIFQLFFSTFRKSFRKSCLIGMCQVFLSVIFVADFQVFWNMEGTLKIIMIPVLLLIGFFFIGMSLYLYPLMAKFDMTIKQLVKNAFLFTAGRPLTPILILTAFGIFAFICAIARFLPFMFAFSICGSINYRLVSQTVNKVNKMIAKAQ